MKQNFKKESHKCCHDNQSEMTLEIISVVLSIMNIYNNNMYTPIII